MKTVLALAFSILTITGSYAQSPNADDQLLFAPDQPAPPEQPCITLSNKKILCGKADDSGSQLLSVFKGVQYGQAARWQPSSVFDEYEPNGYEALQYGARCPQPIWNPKDQLRGEEDCLYMNIWRRLEPSRTSASCRLWCFSMVVGSWLVGLIRHITLLMARSLNFTRANLSPLTRTSFW